MNKLVVKLSIATTMVGLLCATPSLAQMVPPSPKASSVALIQQPTLEIAYDDTAIVRWTISNPGGAEDHFAVIHYGTDPNALTQTAKSHIRLNPSHSTSVFRVRIDGLQPQTTYYYAVTSTEASGTGDGMQSGVNQFTTPAPGQRIVNFPPPQG